MKENQEKRRTRVRRHPNQEVVRIDKKKSQNACKSKIILCFWKNRITHSK